MSVLYGGKQGRRFGAGKFIAGGLVAIAATTAFATDYVWSGGASGEWTESANWEPNTGYPNGADDTAAFAPGEATAVTVASAIAVKGLTVSGEGALTLTGAAISLGANGIASASTAACGISNDVSIAAAQTPIALTGSGPLHMGGVISGDGGIYKTGHAYLHLYRDNPFKGVYEAKGDRTRPDGSEIVKNSTADGSGDTFIYAGRALGTNRAYFDRGLKDSSALCARLVVVGGMEISIPIDMTGDCNNNGSMVFLGEGDVSFTGDLYSPWRARIFIREAKAVHFYGKLGHANYLNFHCVSGSDCYLYAPISGSCQANCIGSGTPRIHLLGMDSTSCNWFQEHVTIVCEGENVIPPQLDFFEMPYADSRIDLNGYDQKVSQINLAKFKQYSGTQHGFTSGAKAKFRLVGSKVASFGARWSFYGNAGFEWDPQNADTTFIQSNAVSATHGELAVKSGKYRLANGASFTSLSSLTVANGATFEVDAGSGANFLAGEVKIEAAAHLALGSGVNLKAGTLTIGGDSFPVGTVVSAATHPGLIDGDGTITVTGAKVLPRNSWTGASGGKWNDDANWSAGVPTEEYEAYVANASVVVDAAIPKAGVITVGDKGVITCSGPFTDEANKATLHLVCGDLVVEKGGRIDASQKGWSGGLWTGTPPTDETLITDKSKWTWTPVNAGRGYGPGSSSAVLGSSGFSGATHGGLGGAHRLNGTTRVVPYGDAAQPTTAGSGGDICISYGGEVSRDISAKTTGYCRGWSGGGVVRIEATGDVRVDGEIRADGKGANNAGGSRDTASAGGSVWITCRTISGAGTVSAAGGSMGDPRFPYYYWQNTTGADGRNSHPGGGGRIAIDYDSEAEAAADVSGLLISAAAGEYHSNFVTLATRDQYESKADAGTIHLSDAALAKRLFGKGISGRVVGLKELAFDGDVEFTRGFFQPAEAGFSLSVGGDLTVSGAAARLEVGGMYMTNRASRADIYAGAEVIRLTVGGDLAVRDGGSLAIRSAEQPEAPVKDWGKKGTEKWGAEVTVTGAMTIGNKSCVYSASDGITLASPKFTVGSLTVDEGGAFSANRGGGLGKDCHSDAVKLLFLGTTNVATSMRADHADYFGYGPGGGYKPNAAGHGGVGGRGFEHDGTGSTYGIEGVAYDDLWFPAFAGSGGSSYEHSYGSEGGTGGGVVHVTSAGAIVVNGTVSADGWCGVGQINTANFLNYQQVFSSGAGGTVFLAGDTVSFGAKAKVSAKGGSAVQGNGNRCAATGGGGRIAIWTGVSNFLKDSYRMRQLDECPAEFKDADIDASAGDSLIVIKDQTRNADQLKLLMGKDGTVAFGRYEPKPGYLMFIR